MQTATAAASGVLASASAVSALAVASPAAAAAAAADGDAASSDQCLTETQAGRSDVTARVLPPLPSSRADGIAGPEPSRFTDSVEVGESVEVDEAGLNWVDPGAVIEAHQDLSSVVGRHEDLSSLIGSIEVGESVEVDEAGLNWVDLGAVIEARQDLSSVVGRHEDLSSLIGRRQVLSPVSGGPSMPSPESRNLESGEGATVPDGQGTPSPKFTPQTIDGARTQNPKS